MTFMGLEKQLSCKSWAKLVLTDTYHISELWTFVERRNDYVYIVSLTHGAILYIDEYEH